MAPQGCNCADKAGRESPRHWGDLQGHSSATDQALKTDASHPVVVDEADEVLRHPRQLRSEPLPTLQGPIPASATREGDFYQDL